MTLQSINVPFGTIFKLVIKMSHKLLKETYRRFSALLTNMVIEYSWKKKDVLLGNDVLCFLIVSRAIIATSLILNFKVAEKLVDSFYTTWL